MKRKVVNEKVIRAMAIGISAMLATATPMTAMAAEGEGDPEGGNSNEAEQTTKPASDVYDDAQEAASDALDGTDDAKDSAAIIKDDVKNVVAGEAGVDSEGKDLAQEVINAAEKVENTTIEDGTPLADAETDITNTKIQLDTAEANDGLSDSALGKATDAAANAGTIAGDLNDAMDKANAKVDEQLDDIQNATTIAGANAAYDELASTAEQAQKDFDAKLADYDKAKAAYDEAAAKVKEYEDAYNAAVAAADSNAAAALAELEKAQENAADLEAAVSAAKDAVDASVTNAMKIADAEALTQTDGTLNWRNEDTLFAAIMTNYYLPEKLGIKDATVTRVQGKDNNEYNYFKVEYNDADGNPQVKYYNYKMDNGSKDDIVIFEKREVEIFGDPTKNPDQYVKDNNNKMTVAVGDVAAGVDGGTIVKVDGKYVEKNDMTDSKTLVSDSEKTGTSTKDVTVDENTKQESWKYDAETGELVKTVTADVTTITYTDATFKSNESYATDAERDTAAEAKKAELEEATGKDATINETENTTYTYTASGTYIPTFTKTVNVNKEYESGYLWYEADSKKEAQDKAYDWAKDKIDDDLGDYYLIGNIESDLSVSMTEEETEEYKLFGKTHTRVTDDSDYLVTGTVTATYAQVTKQTVDQSTFGAIWDDIKALFGNGKTTNEKLAAAAKEAVEADGGIFLSANWDDLSFNKATIRYVAGVKVTTGEEKTEQAAKDAVQGAALAQAKANGATGVYNVDTTGTNDIAHTTYSYTVDYLKQDTKTTKNKTVATETYSNAVGLTGQIIQNKNYKDGEILLNQRNDKYYRAFVDDAKAITGKYDRLLGEAQQANADVQAAQKQVEALQKAIDDLKGKSNNVAALTELTAKLETAKANRDAAEGTLNTILEKLENAGVTRDQVIERLTPPAPTGGDGGETGGETEGTPLGTTTVTGTLVTTAAVQGTGVTATVATTTVGGGAVAQTGAGDGGIVNIDDEETALAASVDDVDDTANVVEIGDEETPLAASVDNETMSWWWLLLIALLGATGYEMYRKHQQKKEALAETDDVQ